MERFLASLSNELFKLRKRKKYLVFLIIGAVICRRRYRSTLLPMYASASVYSAKAGAGSTAIWGLIAAQQA